MVRPVVEAAGLELVEAIFSRDKGRPVLRVIVDRDGGLDLDTIGEVSERIGRRLDLEGFDPGPYSLEVSSPGMDRKLVKASEYERFTGRLARVSLSQPVENCSFYEGRLAGCSEGVVRLDVKGRIVALPLVGIRKAQLVVEL